MDLTCSESLLDWVAVRLVVDQIQSAQAAEIQSAAVGRLQRNYSAALESQSFGQSKEPS
jgi:hypothetical protein